jgi:hypothetical protein
MFFSSFPFPLVSSKSSIFGNMMLVSASHYVLQTGSSNLWCSCLTLPLSAGLQTCTTKPVSIEKAKFRKRPGTDVKVNILYTFWQATGLFQEEIHFFLTNRSWALQLLLVVWRHCHHKVVRPLPIKSYTLQTFESALPCRSNVFFFIR